MTEKPRHAAGRVMFGKAIGGQHKGKPRIAWRCEAILGTRKPMLRRICVVQIKFIRDWRLERLVMRWKRPIFQTFRHVNPAQPVLVEHERRVAGNRVQAFCAYLRFVVRRFSLNKSGNINTGPFFRVPPNQFFSFTPGTPVWPRTRAIVNDAAVARPREAPAVPEIIPRLARSGLVDTIAAENAGINPAAGRGGSVGF